MSCNNITTNGLAIHIDINDKNSYDNISGSAESLLKWKYSKGSDMSLEDYGLNQYDIAKSSSLNESKNIYKNDNLKLEPISYYLNGVVNTPNINHIVNSNVGDYIQLDGGYLNGVFKYHGYDYELLPRRFNEGITIETTVLIQEDIPNNGSIFFMGARAIDKFNINDLFNYIFTTDEFYTFKKTSIYMDVPFYGEVKAILNKVEYNYLDTNIFKININPLIEKFHIYVNGILINNDEIKYNLYKKEIYIDRDFLLNDKITIFYYILDDPSIVLYGVDFEKLEYYVKETDNLINSIFSIEITPNKQIGLKLILDTNDVKTFYANKKLINGWNHIVCKFTPYKELLDGPTTIDDDCNYENRMGDFHLYLNGIEVLKLNNFKEIIFNGLEVDRSRQIGLGYNISWGGDTFGLNNSYIFDENDKNSLLYNKVDYSGIIENNYNNNFIGGLQVLRIYTRSLSYMEIRNNYLIESVKLGISVNKGGRIIYK